MQLKVIVTLPTYEIELLPCRPFDVTDALARSRERLIEFANAEFDADQWKRIRIEIAR